MAKKQEKKQEAQEVCSTHHCSPKCMGSKMLVLGILIILNAIYSWFSWAIFVGGIIGIKGLMMLVCPVCGCKKK